MSNFFSSRNILKSEQFKTKKNFYRDENYFITNFNIKKINTPLFYI